MTPLRTTVWNPDISIFMSYVPGVSDGKRYAPPASVTPVMSATSTGLLIVTVAPGSTPPCASFARIRMLPVWTCASAVAAKPRTIRIA